MKTNYLHFLSFLLVLAFYQNSEAQVTIDQSNFLRGTTYTDTVINAKASVLGWPSEGPGQVWDYSALEEDVAIYTEHYSVNNHPDFPEATTYYRSDLTFQGFPIINHNYETVDAMGWSVVGQEITDVTFSITMITGGPNDSLRFVGGNYAYPVWNDLIRFPLNYGGQWTDVLVGHTPFELTVAAFGLDKVPGRRKRTVTSSHHIVGYGELTIPTREGLPSEPMEVLLMKTVLSSVDSVFLGGAPAPPPLLTAFGLAQGATMADSSYLFYKPGFGSAVLFHSIDSSGRFTYRPQAAETATAVSEMAPSVVRSYPNPVQAGEPFYVEMEKTINSGNLKLMDVAGRTVHSMDFTNNYSNLLQINVPESLGSGLYIYQILDQFENITGAGKVITR